MAKFWAPIRNIFQSIPIPGLDVSINDLKSFHAAMEAGNKRGLSKEQMAKLIVGCASLGRTYIDHSNLPDFKENCTPEMIAFKMQQIYDELGVDETALPEEMIATPNNSKILIMLFIEVLVVGLMIDILMGKFK